LQHRRDTISIYTSSLLLLSKQNVSPTQATRRQQILAHEGAPNRRSPDVPGRSY